MALTRKLDRVIRVRDDHGKKHAIYRHLITKTEHSFDGVASPMKWASCI